MHASGWNIIFAPAMEWNDGFGPRSDLCFSD